MFKDRCEMTIYFVGPSLLEGLFPKLFVFYITFRDFIYVLSTKV
jgi:hypothetical protein